MGATKPYTCPHCGKVILSASAMRQINYLRKAAKERGGYIFEGARIAYEQGKYQDAELSEMLASGALQPHPDPQKGYVVKW